jgi:P4 family phage/plasmid primase-like protien
MGEVPEIFNQPGAAFVLLPVGIKYPPIEDGWQKPENAHAFHEASAHKGNVGILAGNCFIGLDQDEPTAFEGLELPITTTWETRPGRLGMWFKVSDSVAEALAGIGKKADQAQLKLYKDGKHCGEVKLQRTYQAIPPSHKFIDPITGEDVAPGRGNRVDYRLLDSSPPATISLAKLLADLQAIGITFSSKLETNAEKLESKVKEARQRAAVSDEARTRRYAEAALRDEALAVAGSPTGSRNDQLNRSAFSLGQFVAAGVLSEVEVIRELSRAAVNAGLEPDEIDRTIRSGLESGTQHPREIPNPEGSGQKGVPKLDVGHEQAARHIFQRVDCEELTEGGNAQRLERLHGDGLRYNHTLKKWHIWDSGRWQIDDNGGAMRIAGDVVRELYQAAGRANGKDARNALAAFAKSTDSRRGLTNMLALAANRLKFALTADDFDKDPWLLGAGDVTVDLKSGSIRESRQADLITKSIGLAYDRSARCPMWEAFLIKIFPDEDLRKYVKRAVGYCLTGSMVEQIFFFCYGMGANGKSVFLAILRALLGEYARQADFSTFLVQRNEKVRNDLAALAGARVITAIEAEEGGRLSMQVIKAWTGGDPITARYLFGENFTFNPAGKIWLAANNKPAITERNLAAWRRVRLIPFNVTIPDAEQDKELESKLLAELPGILNWALAGLKKYREHGLTTPKAVLDATNDYRKENDSLEQFIAECCDVGKLKTCKNSELYGAYQSFCGMSGLKALTPHKFSPELSAREGIKSVRSKQGMDWLGIALKLDWCSFEDKATSLSLDSIGVDLEKNAQSSLNSPSRGTFTHKATQATPPIQNEAIDIDSGNFKATPDDGKATPANTGQQSAKVSGNGLSKFKAGIKKRTCVLCGELSLHDLVIHYNGGYICARCHREGPPSEPVKADSQTKIYP